VNNKLRYVIDTSVLVDGRATPLVEEGTIRGTVIVPESVIAELESQANYGRETGMVGINEVKQLQEYAKDGFIELKFVGERPTMEEIQLSKAGAIDDKIRKVAIDEGAILVTSDRVQADVASSKGIEVLFVKQERLDPYRIKIWDFFDPETMSVHLKESVPPLAKKGKLGALKLVKVRESPCRERELREMAQEILEAARQNPDCFIEIERLGVTVVQLKELRIAIARPPFSDGLEITAVRPVAKVSLDEYNLSEELKKRFIETQRGILIAGPPGAGKSTFAASLAEYLLGQGYIVKTMESPRDLIVKDEITQYSPLEGNMALTADILLLVRPDYTIYDEVRKTSDFQIFADMRLAGVGMIGVMHATRPIDAIQRMLGRVELGVIPQVVDTIVFIEAGKVAEVYELEFTVKVPYGMYEEDLSRPVIEVRTFEDKEVKFEIYTYGEEIIVMPVKKKERKKSYGVIEKSLEQVVRKYVSEAKVELISDRKAIVMVPENEIPRILGRKGSNITAIEKEFGIKIDVRELKRENKIEAMVDETARYYIIQALGLEKKTVDLYVDGTYLFSPTVSSKGYIRVRKDKELGKILAENMEKGRKLYIVF
jgi:ATPase